MVATTPREEAAQKVEPLTPEQKPLYERNLPLIRWAARYAYSTSPLVRRRLDKDDCEGHAAVGLAMACRGYDPSRGTFGTHAACCCVRQIKEAAYNATLIHIPRYQQFNCIKNRPHQFAPNALRAMGKSVELDGQDVAAPVVEEPLDATELKGAMGKLRDRERHVIKARFWEGKTLEQVGDELGVTKEAARQIQLNAIKNLRNALPSR